MPKARILLVEDDEKIRELISMYMERENYRLDVAADGISALNTITKGFDLVILEEYDVPILILTARGAEYERLLGFELGADDYIVKQFNPMELVARVKVFLKRTISQKQKIKSETL